MKSSIIVTHQSVGYHRWPDAQGERAYLATRHRHLFHVKVCAAVHHDDRDIEFHDFKDELDRFMPRGELGAQSCETMATTIIDRLNVRWPDRVLWCEVWEDDECGARVET